MRRKTATVAHRSSVNPASEPKRGVSVLAEPTPHDHPVSEDAIRLRAYQKV